MKKYIQIFCLKITNFALKQIFKTVYYIKIQEVWTVNPYLIFSMNFQDKYTDFTPLASRNLKEKL